MPVSVLIAVGVVIAPGKTYAITENNQNVPSFISSFDKNCGGFKHAQFGWLSAAGNNSVVSTTINEGTTSINLRVNFLNAQCNTNINAQGSIVNKELKNTRFRAISASSSVGTLSGIVGVAKDLSTNDSHWMNLRYVTEPYPSSMPVHQVFNLAGLGNLPVGNHVINVTVNYRVVHQYDVPGRGNVYVCVRGDGAYQEVSNLDDAACPPTPTAYAMPVTVAALKAGAVDSTDCKVVGWALYKPNREYRPQIHVYIDGPAGVGQGYAFSPGPLPVNGVAQEPGPGQYKVLPRTDVRDVYYPGGTYTSFGFEIPKSAIPQFNDWDRHRMYVYAVGGNNSGSLLLRRSSPPVNAEYSEFGPCETRSDPRCNVDIAISGTPVSDGVPEVGQEFTLNVKQLDRLNDPSDDFIVRIVNGERTANTPEAAAGATDAVTFDPNTRNNPTGGTEFGVSYLVWKGEGNPQTRRLSMPQAGTYTVRLRLRWGNAGSQWDILCTKVFSVANKPYLKVFGNDTAAGSYFERENGEDDITTLANDRASILAFGQSPSANTWKGAGDQLAATARGAMWEFASAAMHSSVSGVGDAVPLKGLTFGNYFTTSADAANRYGGLSGLSRKITNYYARVSQAISTSPMASSELVGTGSGWYRPASGTLIINGLNVAAGQKRAIVVDGDVQINGNITYGPYTSVGDMPSLYIIAKGNIKIAGSVTQLSGVYIAQPKDGDTAGTIYTCTTSSGERYSSSVSASQCGSKLTINGAFIAQQVKFWRTGGSTASAGAVNAGWDEPIAEVFKSSGQLYLSAPDALKKPSSSNNRTYDSVTSLPPVL